MADTDKAMKLTGYELDPNYHYCWSGTDARSLVEMQMDGYKAVNINDPSGAIFKGDVRAQDNGQIKLGDALLMRCRKEEYEARDKDRVKRANEWVKKVKEEFKAEGARLGIQAYEEDTP